MLTATSAHATKSASLPAPRDTAMTVFLRLFADCRDAADAATLQAALLHALAPWQPQPHAAPARYWKIPEYFEFAWILHPGTAATLHAVHALAPRGWTDSASDGEHSCVWNRSGASRFLHPAVAWAELALQHA